MAALNVKLVAVDCIGRRINKRGDNMTVFVIGILTMTGLIPVIVKLNKAEKDFSNIIKREHEKTLQGIARYNEMKKRG